MVGTIRAGGLASGLDSNSIIDSIVTLQGASVEKIEKKAAAVKVKISSFGTITSKLNDLKAASAKLANDGVRGLALSSTHSSFSATVANGATPGRFDVEVTQLATAARARSGAFSSETAPVTGGTLHFDVDGAGFDISVTDGMSLQDLAKSINDSEAPVNAAVLFDGTNAYLSVTRSSTGHAVGQPPASALAVTMTTTGQAGEPLNISVVEAAQNTVAMVDGLRFERSSTTIAGAVPGVTIEANKVGPEETIVVNDNVTKTQERLQSFVDAYNVVLGLVQGELDIKAETDRNKTLGGDPTLRFLQGQLQATLTSQASSGVLRSLADIGLKSGRDGQLSIDTTVLTAAINRGGDDVDRVIQTALNPAIARVTDAFTRDGGIIDARTDGLSSEQKRLDEDVIRAQLRVDKLRERLVMQFTAMESIVSSLQATGSFLSSLSAQQSKNS